MKTKLLFVQLAVVGTPALASGSASNSNAGVGLFVFAVVVALAYVLVGLVRAGGVKKTPTDNAIDFDKFTTPSDAPSIERY
jgi:hypothetical protein